MAPFNVESLIYKTSGSGQERDDIWLSKEVMSLSGCGSEVRFVEQGVQSTEYSIYLLYFTHGEIINNYDRPDRATWD